MKKILSFFLLLILSFFLVSCDANTSQTNATTNDYVTLPMLSGKSTEEAKSVLLNLGLNPFVSFDKTKYYGPNNYGKFISYRNHQVWDSLKVGESIRILSSPLELPNVDLSLFTFKRDVTGKSFINDSYGEVTWTHYYADGDTTSFIDNVTQEVFTLRYLCIDTPEISHSSNDKGDPWGEDATSYMVSLLENAKTIIVESESDTTKGLDNYNRYLGYVWADGICVNYAIIAQAYSNYTGNDKNKYDEVFSVAAFNALKTGRRFYGEYDPNYDYN